MMTKSFRFVFPMLLALRVCLSFCPHTWGQSPGATGQVQSALTSAQWQDDVRFLIAALEKQHPNPYRRTKKDVFDATTREFLDEIPKVSQDEIVVGLMRIVALVRDGHTGLFPRRFLTSGAFPVRLYRFDDGLFIQRAAAPYQELAGSRILKIGSVSADEAFKRAASIAASDNEMGALENAPIFLSIPEILHGLGIITARESVDITIDGGAGQRTITLRPAATVNDVIRPPDTWSDFATSQPLYRQHKGDIFWLEYLKDQKVLYVQQNAVANKPDEQLSKFYEKVIAFSTSNPVDKLVIDLRQNDGGNNGLNRPIIIDIIKSKFDEPGRLFVITGRATFSAAQNFVNEFEKYTHAIFVGEPTAGHPNHYGDNRPVTLPNSGLEVRISTIYWQDVDPRDTRQWTAPEMAASLTSADYRRGIDPALNAIIDYKQSSSLSALIDTAKTNTDIALITRQLEAFTADPKHKYLDTEPPINRLGYDLLNAKRVADGVEIFKLNAKLHPQSANVYDSLGDGYQAIGNKDEAIKAYSKALSIDPNNASSLAALKKLKGQ